MSEARKSAQRQKAEHSPTERQRRFAEEYLIDLNGTQAAIRAGYSPKTANEQAVRLLANVSVRKLIDEGRAKQAERAGLSAERVLQEAMRLAFFDIRKLVDADGKPIPISQLDADTAAAIQGLDVASVGNMDVGIGQVLKYKIADKNSAIERLFKHLGLFEKDNKQSNPGDAMTQFLAELSARGSRLPVKRDEA